VHGANTDGFANLLCAGKRGIGTAIIEHGEKLFTAIAADKIIGADG
jgi:hypothetical protein